MRRARYLLLLASGFLIGIVFGTVIYPLMQKYKSPPLGDYGDAPDGFNAGYMPPFYRVVGRFPTKYKTEKQQGRKLRGIRGKSRRCHAWSQGEQ